MAAKRTTKKIDISRATFYEEFLDFFYQVHYRLGMSLEAAMCSGIVSRTQAAVLWLIASEIGEGGQIRRKDIERRLGDWFETTNSNVSKLLRDLAKPPLVFIVQKESPSSGREKVVTLTPAGMAFVRDMKRRGFEYFQEALAHMNLQEMEHGAHFFEALFSHPPPPRVSDKHVPIRRGGTGTRKRRATKT